MKAFLFFVLFVGTVGLGYLWYKQPQLPRVETTPINTNIAAAQTLTDVSLIDHEGNPFSFSSWKGHPFVVDFFFTRCMGPCPLMTERMKVLSEKLKGTSIRFLSISIDPTFDQPDILKSYAEKHELDTTHWTLTTGDQQMIVDLASKQFKFATGDKPDLHSTRFVLVDAAGVIQGYYDSAQLEEMDKLAAKLQEMGG